MLTQERQNRILEILDNKNAVTVIELSQTLNTSESTIRRDLNKLSKQGKLNKVFGGATANSQRYEAKDDSISSRLKLHQREKDVIGEYAASLINNYDLVFIDAGTTTGRMIEYIENKNATYITNAIDHGSYLMKKGFNVYILGGKLKQSTECVIGADCIANIQKFNFTKSFVGVNGIEYNSGLTTPDIEEGNVKAEILKHSYTSFILADNSKFNRVYPISFGKVETACIITDRLRDNKFKDYTVIKEVLV